MNQEKLEKLLESLISSTKGESETVEFKVNNENKIEIGKRLSALSNSANLRDKKKAYLVFGVSDDSRNIVGTYFSPKNNKVGNEPLEFWLSKMLNPRIDFEIHEFDYKNKKIVIFEIPPALSQPVKFDGISYIRIGSATPKLCDYPEKERRIWNNINKNIFEKCIAKENLTITEVLSLLDYSSYFTLTKQELPSETSQFLEKMSQHGLVNKNFDNDYDVTNLGAILFAKNMEEFPSISRKSVRVIIYEGVDKSSIIKEWIVPLGYAVAFESLVDYINDKLPQNEEISRSLRENVKMYPEVAIREFVANALIHQDLSISGAGPTIEILSNRVEITNTGEPLIDVDRFIDHPPRSRNEKLASFMRQIGVCEEGGTGVDRALIHISLYQLPAPNFEKYDNFTKITIYSYRDLKDMTMSDKIRACYQHCVLKYVENARMTNSTLRERLGIGERNYPAASSIIKATLDKKLIKESEKSKEYIPFWA